MGHFEPHKDLVRDLQQQPYKAMAVEFGVSLLDGPDASQPPVPVNVKRELPDELLTGVQPRAKAPRKANSGSSASATGPSRCKICGEPAEKKSLYCGREKRSYESIYRSVTKLRPKGKDKESKEAQKLWEENDPQYQAFQLIFGPGGDECLQAKVLLDFATQFPESQVKGKARGVMDLTTYSKHEGIREETGRFKGRPLLDWELFQHKMSTKRGWMIQKAWTLLSL